MALKRVLSVIIALFLMLSPNLPEFSAYQTTTYQMSSDNLTMFSDYRGVSLISYHGGDCHIERLSPTVSSSDLHFKHHISAVSVSGNTVAALCNDSANHQLEVYTYRPDTDVLDSFAVNGVLYYGSRGFCYVDDSIYLVSDRNINTVERYSSTGALQRRYAFDSAVTQLGADYRGNVFAVSEKRLYYLNNNRFTAYGGNTVTAPITYFAGDLLSDASGSVYRIQNTNCCLLFKADADCGGIHAAFSDGIVYYPCGYMIYGYRLGTGEKVSEKELSSDICGVYADRGSICAVVNNGSPTVCRIVPKEFTDLTPKYTPTYAEPMTAASEFSTDAQSDSIISSSIYQIDFSKYQISGIPSGTTFAKLKSNIRHDGYEMRLYRSGSRVKSGKCGTGMTVIFNSDRASYTFELSVIGDITGEGSVNSRDHTLLMEYLLGSADFSGVYFISADLDNNQRIDVKDLALLHKMI